MEIGTKIRDLRLKSQLTQEELADRCELTKGYISQIENDLTSPSIATLVDILKSLGTDMTAFFAREDDEQIVFRAGDQFEKETDESVIRWLVPTAQKNAMEPILMSLKPGAGSGKDLPHDGEEFGYVLKGKLKLTVGKRELSLNSGDTFYFLAERTHFIENVGDTEAQVIWVSCPPNF